MEVARQSYFSVETLADFLPQYKILSQSLKYNLFQSKINNFLQEWFLSKHKARVGRSEDTET